MQGRGTIKARAIIPIYFSSVTNTSKKLAYMLQEKLEESNFLATVTNIGDVDKEQFLEHQGPLILILSTYGNGGSPADGEDFREWLRQLEKRNYFSNIQFAILGLGNRSFEHFCGNSIAIRELLLFNGAKEITQLVTCNSASTDETGFVKFPLWSDTLISILKQRYEIREINAQQLLQKFKVVPQNFEVGETDWEKDRSVWQSKLGKQFLTYYRSFKSDVIHIRQLRQQNDGRSTLWVRLKIPEGLLLQPACNISVYPENVREQGQEPFKGSFSIMATKKNAKIPYPPLPLETLWKISNFTQIADLNIIKYALTMSNEEAGIKNKYAIYLKNPEQLEKNPVRCHQLNQHLKPGIDFLIKVGINSVRPYTLASWEPQKGYFDLVASIDPLGLTSKYFQSRPTSIRILPTHSSFYAPTGRPVVMIANGSGIAPFRSLTQYLIKHDQAPILYLYFGIQNKKVDFYFREEWEALEKEGKIKLRVAESRAADKKCYIQSLVKEDKQFFAEHLFKNKGVIFICGSASMAKGVDTELFESIKIHQPIPFKAFKLSTELLKNKTIVKEIFD